MEDEMTDLKLVFPADEYIEEWYSIVKEIEDANEKMTPYALKGNTYSARTIIKNGGILENEVLEDSKLVQRYWIAL